MTKKEETPCLRCNVETEKEFNEECVKCSGPTASLNDSGLCTCAKTRGMILNNGVCECNAAKNFVLDVSTEKTCKCSDDSHKSVDGICRKEDDGVRWGDSVWGDCKDGKRQRPLKSFDCEKKVDGNGETISWWNCVVTRARVFEECGDTASNGRYNSSKICVA